MADHDNVVSYAAVVTSLSADAALLASNGRVQPHLHHLPHLAGNEGRFRKHYLDEPNSELALGGKDSVR